MHGQGVCIILLKTDKNKKKHDIRKSVSVWNIENITLNNLLANIIAQAQIRGKGNLLARIAMYI